MSNFKDDQCGRLTDHGERLRLSERKRAGHVLEEDHTRSADLAHDLEVVILHIHVLVRGRVVRQSLIEAH